MQSRHSAKHDFIMESLRQASPMLWNMARQFGYEFDELYQVAAVTAMEAYDRAQKMVNPRSYLHRALHYAVMRHVGIPNPKGGKQTLASRYQIVSLDALGSKDSDLSLYDLVEEATPAPSRDRDLSRLYTLINALPEIYRTPLCMRFGLCGYGVHQPCEIARILGIPRTRANNRICEAKAMLREYTELRDLVERHL
jgi:DNA-directed RNA polymerase specialized sigma24 family protein